MYALYQKFRKLILIKNPLYSNKKCFSISLAIIESLTEIKILTATGKLHSNKDISTSYFHY